MKQIDFDGRYSYSNIVEVDFAGMDFILGQNYPNPFNPETTINFSLPKDEFVTLKIYNSLGEEIAVIINSFKNAGSYEIKFDGNELSNGVYFYELKAGSFSSIKKMILLK